MNEIMSIIFHHFHVPLFLLCLIAIARQTWKNFVLPSRKLSRDLLTAIQQLEQVKKGTNGSVVDLEEIAQKVMVGEKLSHLWNEYCETLHGQKRVNELGQEKVTQWRSTALAETFFTEHALVDTPLKTEFYKHLPGILTGIGIIGTFLGLIIGLVRFEVSSNAEIVRTSLRNLIQGVGYAFVVSGLAIALAMLFTYFEKARVTQCYKLVEELCHLIDSLFDAGAGEEYLARLVQASEASATQASQIKDSLVVDLKQILSELSTQQIEATRQQGQQLSTSITQSFSEGLRLPMERISQAVDRVGTNQGEAVNKLLTDVLANFTAQMQEIFGGQLRGMNDLLQQTSGTMQSVAARFDQITNGLKEAGQGAAAAMAERLDQATNSLEARQQIMNKQMGEFVVEIRSLLQDSQTETAQKMQTIIGELGEKVSCMVTQLEEQSRQTHEVTRSNQTEFVQKTSSTMGDISTLIHTLAEEVRQASDSMRNSVSSLAQASRESIDRLNAGAETLYVASSDFAKAGQGVSTTMQAATQATDNIQGASLVLSDAAMGVQNILNNNQRASEAFASIVSDLNSTIENARQEASITSDIISKFKGAAEHLGSAQSEAEEYLNGVTQVLAQAHKEFAQNVERTLRQGNSQFHKELSDAVSLLNGAIKDFGDTLDSVMAKRS